MPRRSIWKETLKIFPFPCTLSIVNLQQDMARRNIQEKKKEEITRNIQEKKKEKRKIPRSHLVNWQAAVQETVTESIAFSKVRLEKSALEMSSKKILIVGGTGYLGQHLLQELTAIQDTLPYVLSLAFTYHTNPPPEQLLKAIPHALPFHVDLRTGNGFDDISQNFGQPDVVVNCAALSVPRACEVDPTAAMAINMPSVLVKWLSSFSNGGTLLIHLSTDQVYEGTKSFYKEDDETLPVNVYGRSKVAAEQFISANYSHFAILRSSIIYGPQTVSPVPKSLPVQWMDSVLAKGEAMDFFHDEFRCPVYVKDLVTIIWTLTNRWISERKPMQLLLNVGGPDRVSRVQMAEAVAHIRGYSLSLIKSVSSSTVNRGVKSPADISMNITRLIQTLNMSPTAFRDGVKLTLEAEFASAS